jgi:hypothetical protein
MQIAFRNPVNLLFYSQPPAIETDKDWPWSGPSFKNASYGSTLSGISFD